MNILVPNSWLKEFLNTNATPKQFATAMSLTSVSIERMEEVADDVVFDIEVTTNRPELMSIEELAREACAVLPQQGYTATFKPHKSNLSLATVEKSPLLDIKNDKTLVNRILAVILEVELSPSPKIVTERLEKTGIRSLNNVIDVTNYIMREVGHPAHVFDYDRLLNHTLIIRKSKKGEKLVTLDEKNYELPGNDIVADNGKGEIVDLLGIMGTANSAVTNSTKRVVLFLDNNNPQHLRKTSMNLGIRTEAAIINEKGIDPNLMLPTLYRGIELLKENANAKIISPIIDIYPNRPEKKNLLVEKEKVDKVIGIAIPEDTVVNILKHLGFATSVKRNFFEIEIPTSRINDIDLPEDIIEEIARVYGYHKIPNLLPPFTEQNFYHQDKSEFYWIKKLKEAFLFWGFNETYTYSMVSEEQFDGPVEKAVKLRNPLTEDKVFLRNSLIPSLLEVATFNKNRDEIKIFELSNIYINTGKLPNEILTLAGLIKGESATFTKVKGIIERIFEILGIKDFSFEAKDEGLEGAIIKVVGKKVGIIEVLDVAAFEMDFSQLLLHASSQKIYHTPPKFPPIIEDMRVEISQKYLFQQIAEKLKNADPLIKDVNLLDVYDDKKTFRITYLDKNRNLSNEDIAPIRKKLFDVFAKEFGAIPV